MSVRLLALMLELASSASAAEPIDYLRDIKPILAKNCYACHGANKQSSGLRLDTAAAALEGGKSGRVIVPGKSGDSKLIKAVMGADAVKRMPYKKEPLSAKQIALVRAWIDAGAKYPPGETAEKPDRANSDHWAFQAPARPTVPAVKNLDWPRNPIDCFILARLEKEGIAPSPEADRVTLIRRLSLDLLGLPPTIQEVDAFVGDERPDAYERLVDRLLQSPHFGERWGRHWLDVARYADSNGYSIDSPRSIWKYRDWVIDAINRDMPFDRFTIDQIAGDMLPHATLAQKTATGFHRNTQINEEGGIDLEQFRIDSIVDRVNTTGSVFLGLTIGCCQCHDHKFDPITQREYYQLFAFLNNADEPSLELGTPEQIRKRNQVRSRLAEVTKVLRTLENTSTAKEEIWEKNLTTELRAMLPKEIQTILEIPENGRTVEQKAKLTEAYRKTDQARHVLAALGSRQPLVTAAHVHASMVRAKLEKERTELKQNEPRIPTTMVLRERKTPRKTFVHKGGDFLRKGAQVSPGVPAVLHPLAVEKPTRLDLARWLVDPKNPLTARVTMNRFWQNYFGLGLVETENDFGTQGTPPTHPELLDWLATEFMARQWSMKTIHRLIVTSATYRQASKARPELATVDPRNKLLARQVRLRLDAELVRDGALTASGLLTRKIGGPSVFPPQPEGIYRFTQIDKNWKAAAGPDRYRRGMYTYFWRSAPHPSLTVFDAPDATSACTRRNRSNTPLQALTLLNDKAQFEFAQGLAARIVRECQGDNAAHIRYAFRLCVARQPSEHEQKRLGELLARELAAKDPEAQKLTAWISVARVLLNLDEFITRE
jgi:mono/diheme cytochrome c family protein